MKKIIFIALMLFATSAQAYSVSGVHLSLVSCNYLYEPLYKRSGYMGTYSTSAGGIYRIWFGTNFCQY